MMGRQTRGRCAASQGSRGRLWETALALALVAASAGCGRRGDPLPPEARRPGVPTGLRISGHAGELVLVWDAPAEDLAGRPIAGALGYLVLREDQPPGAEPCESCPDDPKQVAALDPVERRARGLLANSWTDSSARPGWLYRYRIRAVDDRGRLGPVSERLQVRWVTLSPPAAEAVAGDGEAAIRVENPQWPTGVVPLGIRVYRRDGPLLVEGAPGSGEVLIGGLENGTRHSLEVRLAARMTEGWVIESPSTPASVTPRDTTPPLPPSDLAVLRTPEGVRVRWLPAGAEKYAEVLLLRAEGQAELKELVRLPGSATSFLDPTAAPDRAYSYAVVVTDEAGNRSLPTRAVRARSP